MKKLDYCNSIRGNCGNCKSNFSFCNVENSFDLYYKYQIKALEYSDNSFTKTYIEIRIFEILTKYKEFYYESY